MDTSINARVMIPTDIMFLPTTPLFSGDAGGPMWQSAAQVVTLQSFTKEVGPAVSITPSILGTFPAILLWH